MDPLLSLRDVHTRIAGSHILQGVTFDVTRSETTVLLGRNGAGKSTTLRTILGLWHAESGSIVLDGTELRSRPPHKIARYGVGFVPEDREVFASLTIEENLRLAQRKRRGRARMNGSARERPSTTPTEGKLGGRQETRVRESQADPSKGNSGTEQIEVRGLGRPANDQTGAPRQAAIDSIFSMFPDLRAARGRSAGALSGGQQQMLAIGRALVNDNLILLVDEPTKGLAPVIVEQLARTFRSLRESGETILMVEQNLEFARAVGDRYFIVDEGRIVHGGKMTDLADQSKLLRRYIGV